ncbi:hypothetical protein RF679_05995 [Undibacterium cyanobacteriorum]|uniref:Uncharacterized protein n=1 Tax=Undibacterium cyanobacteriorum TaxID=3073561 RepID=A0ABY9RKT0_9BURK|nr:hypothetical protein [Undibacterium sp. 20NA77.5]WMW81832.1 hypothetical protein RF679_05995 [Undibacterium sp. 20NA77.5]
MQQLSIDPSKDAEVYVLDTIDDQRLIYADEYYFFGDVIARTQVVEKSAFPQDGTQLEIDIRAPSPLAQEEFKQEGALCLYFEVELPCVRSANS